MSVYVMSWVFAHSEARGNDRLVLLAIADRADDNGTDAWPSLNTIARKVRCSTRTVIRCIQSLEEDGALIVERSKGGRSSNTYRIVMSEMGSDNLSPVRTGDSSDTDVTAAVPLVSHKTSSTSSTPQPPASGGHCARHIRYRGNCPACSAAKVAARAHPPWCGVCDPATRKRDWDTTRPYRCPECHPPIASTVTSKGSSA